MILSSGFPSELSHDSCGMQASADRTAIKGGDAAMVASGRCARLTGGMLPGESPGRKRGQPTTFSVNHASVAARRQAKRWGAAGVGRAIEPRDVAKSECRGCLPGRRQHPPSRFGEVKRGSAGSKNHGTRRSSPPGPGRSFNRPCVVEGPQRKGVLRNRR